MLIKLSQIPVSGWQRLCRAPAKGRKLRKTWLAVSALRGGGKRHPRRRRLDLQRVRHGNVAFSSCPTCAWDEVPRVIVWAAHGAVRDVGEPLCMARLAVGSAASCQAGCGGKDGSHPWAQRRMAESGCLVGRPGDDRPMQKSLAPVGSQQLEDSTSAGKGAEGDWSRSPAELGPFAKTAPRPRDSHLDLLPAPCMSRRRGSCTLRIPESSAPERVRLCLCFLQGKKKIKTQKLWVAAKVRCTFGCQELRERKRAGCCINTKWPRYTLCCISSLGFLSKCAL